MTRNQARIVGGLRTMSLVGMLLTSTLIMATLNKTTASAQEVPPTVNSMALITTQFGDPLHNRYLFNAEQAVASFKSFYDVNSHGKMAWDVTITPTWHTLPKPFKLYDVSCRLDRGDYFAATYDFITDSLRAASTDIDLNSVDYVMIVYPRYDSIVDHSCTFPARSWVVDDKEYHFGLSIVRESASNSFLNDNVWVMVREANRFLGLPYLFNSDDGLISSAWDVMGWQGGLHNSTLIGGWSKTKLGWVDESNIKTIGYGQKETVTIDPLGVKSSKISLVKVPITTDQYYLIETRVKVGGDLGLPQDVSSGVIITEVDEGSDPAKVTWISNPIPRTGTTPTQIQDLTFSEGDRLSNNLVGSINILSKSQNSYVVEVDRTALYPRIIDGKYDYDGIKYAMPAGWKTATAGWDTYAAKDNPLLSFAKLSGMTMTVRFLEPEIELEDYSSNPFLQNVECRPTYQGYVEINSLIAKETALRCYSTLESGESRAPVAKTYQFGFSRFEAGSTAVDNRLLSLTLVADSPGIFDAYLADFETTVSTVQIRNATDVRQIENEIIGLREYILQVSIANSTMEIPLYTNTAYSNFKFDPDENKLSFKANAKDANGKTRIPYDTFLKGPYVVSVGGKTNTSFLILEDKVSGDRFIQIDHSPGINDILITGMSSVVPDPQPLVVGGAVVEESEIPIEIVFRQPAPEYLKPNLSVSSKWALFAMLVT